MSSVCSYYMAAIGLFGAPNFQLFDDNGDPLAGGFLHVYIAGGSTPHDTWTTSDLNVANDNPIELDSAGRGVAYCNPTPALKLVLTDADAAEIWSQDHVSPGAVAT